MNREISPRVRLVELLWQLKLAYDESGEGKVVFIHFNTLLNDEAYRQAIIQEACQSHHKRIRQLGEELRDLDLGGVLLHKRSSGMFDGQSPAPAPAASAPQRQSDNAAAGWIAKAGLASLLGFALIAAAAYLFDAQVRGWLNGQTLVQGSINKHTTWQAGSTHLLDGLVFVEPGASLSIEAGAQVLGLPGSALIVSRGAQLFARGSVKEPVVFTSSKPVGKRQSGDWGGVVLLGSAQVNQPNAFVEGIAKGDSRAAFGGENNDSSCGLLDYVRIEFAGYAISRDNELNGLTLAGCGGGTLIEHVQVHRPLDDGIEVFGGKVDLKHILITGAGDDSLDWDLGWSGRVQFLMAIQHSDQGDNAFEGDNNKAAPDAQPRSAPVMYNLTLVSPRSNSRYQRAMTLRHGTGGQFHNVIIQGFSGEAIDIGGEASARLAQSNTMVFRSIIFHDIGARGVSWFADESGDKDDDMGFDERHAFFDFSASKQLRYGSDPQLSDEISNGYLPSFFVSPYSPATKQAAPIPQGEFWDEAANYLGAIRPGAYHGWTEGWTDFPLK